MYMHNDIIHVFIPYNHNCYNIINYTNFNVYYTTWNSNLHYYIVQIILHKQTDHFN